jgi:AmmeMemoRadiSam system protein A
MALTEEEKHTLLNIARTTIEFYLRERFIPPFEASSQALTEKRGAFVSIHKGWVLRGCIGVFESEKMLLETVVDMAVAAATQDQRFPPVKISEIPDIELEISALTPLMKINGVSQIEVGRHGLYIIKGPHRGVLLPQVAVEHGFGRDEFLDQTCLKAGLPSGSWKEGADIYVFEAEVFNEKELNSNRE